MSDVTYTFHVDSGHGWLQVPRESCKGLDISLYSYMDAKCAYLEEDDDAPLWMSHNGVTVDNINIKQYEDDCPVRSLPSYEEI